MPTLAPKPEVTRTIAPAGTHVARVFKFMNLGTRRQEYQGKPKDYDDTLVNISWELSNELNEFEVENKETGQKETVTKPFAVSREFTLSMGPKSNLRPIVEGIIGTTLSDDEAYNFDLESLVGMACLVTVAHKKSKDGERTYAKVVSTAPLVKGMEAPAAINTPKIFDVNVAPLEEIADMPEWLREKIEVSHEYKARVKSLSNKVALKEFDKPEYPTDDIDPSDIPF